MYSSCERVHLAPCEVIECPGSCRTCKCSASPTALRSDHRGHRPVYCTSTDAGSICSSSGSEITCEFLISLHPSALWQWRASVCRQDRDRRGPSDQPSIGLCLSVNQSVNNRHIYIYFVYYMFYIICNITVQKFAVLKKKIKIVEFFLQCKNAQHFVLGI